MKKANEGWIDTQCKEIENCLNKRTKKEESIPAGNGSNFKEAG